MRSIIDLSNTIITYWTYICIFIALGVLTYEKIKKYKKMSEEERVNAALKVIKTEVLKLMSDAEINWKDFYKAGEIKKSEVIDEIYERFPFLTEYINQEELIIKISEMIEDGMDKMNQILNSKNK